MSAHTPGPWWLCHVYGRSYAVHIARRDKYHIGTVRGKDNAQLIAAAPDLLDALKALTYWSDLGNFDDSGLSQREFDEQTAAGRAAAKAAIAKATGPAA